MGRPTKSESRTRQFNLSLTEQELDNIRRRAEKVGMRPVHLGRALLFDPNIRTAAIQPPGDNNTQRLIYGQLVRLGNNLNQMVRHLHRTGDPLPPDLEPLLIDIRRIIAQVPR